MDRTLGIDVGTATTGWAVAERDTARPNGIALLSYGVISTPAGAPMPSRLAAIYTELEELIHHFSPSIMSVESLFFSRNQKTVMSVSQVRGVILLAGERAGLRIAEYTPLQVKSAVTGYGKADKKQVQEMVRTLLGLKDIPKPDDAADAVGLCISYLVSTKNLNRASRSS